MRETVIYITLWTVICSGFAMEDPPVAITVFFILLPGALLAGPVGVFFGGRQAFAPAAVIGTILWFIRLLVPAMQAAR